MSKARVIVLSVVHQGLSKADAARRYNVSWQWVHTLVSRYQDGGLDAVEPRSRRPTSNSRATPVEICERIVELRKQLDADGLDNGPVTIASHLGREGLTAPSTSTIRRVLLAAGLITPNPKNGPEAHFAVSKRFWKAIGALLGSVTGGTKAIWLGRRTCSGLVLHQLRDAPARDAKHGCGVGHG